MDGILAASTGYDLIVLGATEHDFPLARFRSSQRLDDVAGPVTKGLGSLGRWCFGHGPDDRFGVAGPHEQPAVRRSAVASENSRSSAARAAGICSFSKGTFVLQIAYWGSSSASRLTGHFRAAMASRIWAIPTKLSRT